MSGTSSFNEVVKGFSTEENEEIAVTSKTKESKAGKYLTFKLADEEYGLEILKVREIMGLMAITQVPQTPHYIRGIINLRGNVIPVVDLRLKFEMDAIEDTEHTCVIVVEVTGSEKVISTGILVDAVSEVLEISENEIEESPKFGSTVNTDFILGIGKMKDSVKILLNIDKVLDSSDYSNIEGLEELEEAVVN